MEALNQMELEKAFHVQVQKRLLSYNVCMSAWKISLFNLKF